MSGPDQKLVQLSLSIRHVASDPTSQLFVQPYNILESCISFSTLHLFISKDKVLRRSVEPAYGFWTLETSLETC